MSSSSATRQELDRLRAAEAAAVGGAGTASSMSSATRAELNRLRAAEAARSSRPSSAAKAEYYTPATLNTLERHELDRLRAAAAAGSAAAAVTLNTIERSELKRLRAASAGAARSAAAATLNTVERDEFSRLKKLVAEKSENAFAMSDLKDRLAEAEKKLEIKAARREAKREEAERQAAIEAMFKSSCAIDLCFVSDATGSMASWIAAVASQITAIAADATSRYGVGSKEVRCSYVAYRDYDDSPNVQVLDFTSNLSDFTTFVSSVRATGGADECEDIFSGLEKVGQLLWRAPQSSSKVLFHLADAPCHGTRFHDGAGDSYPGGDKLGRDICKLLRVLRVEKGIHKYSFSHINSSTKKMVSQFKLCAGAGGEDWIIEDNIGSDTSKLITHVTHSISESVSESMSVASKSFTALSGGERLFTLDTTPVGRIHWDSVPLLKGVRIKHILPVNVAELVHMLDERESLHEHTDKPYFIKVAPNPFSGEGNCRLPYYARMSIAGSPADKGKGKGGGPKLSDDIWVAKLSRSTSSKYNSTAAYKAQMEVQSVAACLANMFNKESSAKVPRLHYTMVNTFIGHALSKEEKTEREVFNFERYIEGGAMCKFNSNYGYVNFKEYVAAVQAFSHWTHHVTGGKLMVVDVQGLYDEKRKQYTLFDPAVHCSCDVLRFGTTNIGNRGMDKFFMTHACNSTCEALRLPPHPMQPKVGGAFHTPGRGTK